MVESTNLEGLLMKYTNKGVSLIALIITITVIVILAVAVIQKGMGRTDDAKLAKHNQGISTTQEEVEGYYYQKGEALPVVNLTPYPIPPESSLLAEITKNNEQNDTFYVVDLAKLGKVVGKEGTGIGDDIYIVSSARHTVYYVKGDNIKGIIYHGLISKNDVKLAQIITPTGGATPTAGGVPTNSPTPTPGSGGWDGIVNSPKLSAGMEPIKFTGAGNNYVDLTPDEILNANNEWYDYRNSSTTKNKWANARLADGSMLVWIPRYTYKILNNENTSTTGDIDIKFSNGTTDETSNSYRVHPAFYWGGWNIPISAPMTKQPGGVELTGIWVGKFEASPREGTAGNPDEDDVTTKHVKIIPNAKSWGCISISNSYTVCKNMQDTADYTTYGISNDRNVVDAHMMKNSEWGAAAYLSKYALGTTGIAINSNIGLMTANTDLSANKTQSTTGTEYGLYDMSGGVWEYVASYVDNGNSYLNTYGNSLYTEAQGKYKDIFPKASTESQANNYTAASQAYGYGLYETSSSYNGSTSWFGDKSDFPWSSSPFFLRSGGCNFGSEAGVFCFANGAGASGGYFGFRSCVVVP